MCTASPAASNRVEIYDTTLRDGTQGEGFNLSLQDKLNIALKLDELGVDYIEGGFPISNPKDEAFFRDIRTYKLKHAKIAAFGMTRRRGVEAKDDMTMKALLAAETPVVTIVGKTSDHQVRVVLGVTLEENLSMIGDSVKLIAGAGREVVYDAEHFFDTYRTNPQYALQTLRAAEQAGAAVLCLCDTNGGTMPEQISEAVRKVKEVTSARIGIHTHNDCGLALANGLAGIMAGAVHTQGTMNGVGERCGNMDLLTMIANLQLKYHRDCLQPGTVKKLTEVSRYVYETANMHPNGGQPYVGVSAFAHKGGMHVHAVQKDASTYEHVSPETVGNERRVLVSEMSGASNIVAKAGKKFDIANDKEALKRVLTRVQDLENAGFTFESAEASFELLLRKEIGRYEMFFGLENYRVSTTRLGNGGPIAEATVKMSVKGVEEHRVAEGSGPVNSLDRALFKALKNHYAAVADLHLIDYKVRVVNSSDETAAAVRVVMEWRHKVGVGALEKGPETFGTIGVSSNIIDATWQALVDGYEYHLLHVKEAGAMGTGTRAVAAPAGIEEAIQ